MPEAAVGGSALPSELLWGVPYVRAARKVVRGTEPVFERGVEARMGR